MIAKLKIVYYYEAIIIEFSDFLKKIIPHFTLTKFRILKAADSLEFTINNIVAFFEESVLSFKALCCI
jgi:hypothetical protein